MNESGRPKLLLFAPCEKIIISQEDNSASVLSILQGFTLPGPMPVGPNSDEGNAR
jgi:hypothetical protein